MSEAASALAGARFQGLVTVEEAGPCGMITLRGDLAARDLAAALGAAVGHDVPERRGILHDGTRAVAWMSPDELLLTVPYGDVPAAVAALQRALDGRFATVADVSDARAVIRVSGGQVRDVLAKLCPVDFSPEALGPGEIRRTRAAQAAVALWFSATDEVTLVCFRSVARYVFDLLCVAAQPGGEVGLY